MQYGDSVHIWLLMSVYDEVSSDVRPVGSVLGTSMTVDSIAWDEYGGGVACWGRVWLRTGELGTSMAVDSPAGDGYGGDEYDS